MRLLFNQSNTFHKQEILIYFGIYVAYIVYGLLGIYNERDRILNLANLEFEQGWKFVNRQRDNTNDELENFTRYIRQWWPWYCVHLIVSVIFNLVSPGYRCVGHGMVGLLGLCYFMKLQSLVLFLTLIITFYAVSQFKSKRLIWILVSTWITIINALKSSDGFWYNTLGYTEFYTLLLTLSWTLLRCCSYVLTYINTLEKPNRKGGLLLSERVFCLQNYFGYILYFPTMVYGPFMTFARYACCLEVHHLRVDDLKPLCKRVHNLFINLARIAFWWFVLNFTLHFVYIHYMERDVEAVKIIQPLYRLHAVGYFMGQFFFIFYVITYGLGIAFARFDNMQPPKPPRCIGRIHFYSDMWKHFDEGLYEFLFKYIYADLCNKNSRFWVKMSATAATFLFVFVWHGCYFDIFIWSFLNFCFLIVEKCLKALIFSEKYENWSIKRLGVTISYRLQALLASQIFIPAAFSNIYFIGGKDVGGYFLQKAYMSGILNYLLLTLCSYSFFLCSENMSL